MPVRRNCREYAKLDYCCFLPLALAVVMLSWVTPVWAHGVVLKYETVNSYVIEAAFEDGTPLAEAQVLVYAPEDPANPWLTGMTDEKGSFVLSPDKDMPGQWAVQIRKAGHGGMVNIAVGEGTEADPGRMGFSRLQQVLMLALGLWGFIGTALYFKRRPG